jgi:FixJ family two-component response regulator
VSRELSIAVIEDDEPFRTALVESLSSLGFGVRGYASANEFVASGGDRSCDCIVTDIHMPGLSGFDLQRLLASRGLQIPFVMITAHDTPGMEARAAAAGAVCLLRKPFETAALIDCLERALRSS